MVTILPKPKYKLPTNHAVGSNINLLMIKLSLVENLFRGLFQFIGKPEIIEIKRNDSMVEDMGEEEEDDAYMDFENNEMPSEEVGEEFHFDEGEMIGEMSTVEDNNVSSTIRSADDPEQEKESDKVSEHSIQSLPIKPYCAVVKLKNKFSFFDRNTNTKSIDMRVRHKNTTYIYKLVPTYLLYSMLYATILMI